MNFKTNIRRQIPFIISTLIALSAVFVYFINPPSQIPDKKLLSIEYNRIAASDTVPYLFKMMEGTYLLNFRT